jgi:hypothetical protein
MVRDGVANLVDRLRERDLDPRRVGDDAWEARCPAHRSTDHALAITRNEFNQVVLECRSPSKCQYFQIIGSLGLTNDHVDEETPDSLICQLSHVPVQASSFPGASAIRPHGNGPGVVAKANRSAEIAPLDVREPSTGTATGEADSAEAMPSQHVFGEESDLPMTGASGLVGILPAPEGAADVFALPQIGSGSGTVTSSEHRACSQNTGTQHSHPSRLSAVERATSGFGYPAEREDAKFLATPPGALSPGGSDHSDGRVEHSPGNSLELLASTTSLTVVVGNEPERVSSVQVLTKLASNARLFRSADGRFCAQVPVGDRLEIYRLKSAAFRDWLIDAYVIDQPEAPSSWAVRRVIGMLEARARFSAGIPEVFIRVGHDGDRGDSPYFLDLGDPRGRAVAIDNGGWSVVDRPGVHFRRPEGLLSLPLPARDGSIELLRPYVNLTEPDFRLMIAWLTAALRPVGPYPILVLNGEQASGKSTLARILRFLIDPQVCPGLALPDSAQNLLATAVNGWLLLYENISAIADSISDCLCQLAFGGGFASRTLFTNDERSVIYAQRPVILVGIDDFVVRGDLRDRCVFLHLPPIPVRSRRTERKFWPAFCADYPRILGGVLDAIAGGLRELPSVDLKELPRMADYAEWGEAVGRGLGWGAETFLSVYNDNRRDATELLLEDAPVATVMLALARKGVNWSGTTMELYQRLSKIPGTKYGRRWPKTVSMFGNELRRIAPQLRLHGLSISFERTRDARIVILRSEGETTGSKQTIA